jgi:hypothetical protein
MASRDYTKHIVSISAPPSPTLGDEWFHPTTNKLYKRVANNGTTVEWREIPQLSLTTSSSGTVTSVSVASSNGFAGSVAIAAGCGFAVTVIFALG